MLDENLPAFFYKRSPDGLQHNTAILHSQYGSDPAPAYSLQRGDPSAAHAKNCYAVALFDSYNPEVLYGEILINPEWTQPSLSAEEIRRNNGVPPPPAPILPTEFTIQLYNPDLQVTVAQKPGTWGGSASYEFSLPQTTFRTPSASTLDRTQNDPAASATTPKINFVWRKESKLAKDLTCFMTGKSTDAVVKKKHRDPDIAVALFRALRELTIYEPNLYRIELEDPKGLEIVLLLSAAIIKDLYFANNNVNAIFNVSDPSAFLSNGGRKTSSPHAIGTGPGLGPPLLQTNPSALRRKDLPRLQTTPPTPATSATIGGPVGGSHGPLPHQQYQRQNQQHQQYQQEQHNRPPVPQQQQQSLPAVDPRTQWELDAETARLKAQVEAEDRARQHAEHQRRRERERADEAETQRLRKMVEAEEREKSRRRQAEIERETERLRREYGVQHARHSAPNLTPISEGGGRPQQHQHQQLQQQNQRMRAQQSQYLRPGPSPSQHPGGFYSQPGYASASSAAVVMSGANGVGSAGAGGSGAEAAAAAKRMQKKKSSFFGLRSHSDGSSGGGGQVPERKVLKKASVMW